MGEVELYDQRNIHCLIWPDTDDGRYAREYLVPLIRDGVKDYIANADTVMMVIKIGQAVLPITINCREYDNSYVCSPYTHYVSYALEELRELNNPGAEKCLAGILRILGFFLRQTECNKVVHVNNWLLSTNLYPDLTENAVIALICFLKKAFPTHALVFRSLNDKVNRKILQLLKEIGCMPVASRQIYGIDLSRGVLPSVYDVKNDLKLFVNTSYEIVPHSSFTAEDVPRIVELYSMLYLSKYSRHNPWFTEKFMQQALRTGIFTFIGFKKDDRLDAVLGFFQRNGAMTTPIFGYDTNQPKSAGLYRLLSIQIMMEATERKIYLNNSSGAAQFKRNRGAMGEIEYSMIYHRHLPWWRKAPWTILGGIVNKFGIPLLIRYRL